MRSNRLGRRGVTILVCVVALVASACSSGSAHKAATTLTASKGLSGSWSGRVDGTNAFVAVVANGEEVVAYICDSAKLAQWFRGPISATGFAVSAGKASVTATRSGGRLLGLVKLPGGDTHAFEAEPAKSGVLYRAEAGTADRLRLGGWVVVDGAQRGAIGTTNPTLPRPPNIVPAQNLNLGTLVVPQLDAVAAPIAPDTISASTPNKTYTYVWAAAGDDYASGDGNPSVNGISGNPALEEQAVPPVWGTGQYTPGAVAHELDACHRSDNAGAPQALRTLQSEFPQVDFEFLSVACLGAETKNLTTNHLAAGGAPLPVVDQGPQLDRVQAFDVQHGHLDSLYMSIGANDAGLPETMIDCIVRTLPGDNCAKTPPADFFQRRAALAQGYDALSSALGARLISTSTKVFVSTYPDFTRTPDGGNCGAPFGVPGALLADPGALNGPDILLFVTDDEMAFLRTDLLGKVNQTLRDRAAAHGWTVIDGHEASFAKHGICVLKSNLTSDSWFNTNNAAVSRQLQDMPIRFPPGANGIDLRPAIQATIAAITVNTALVTLIFGVGVPALVAGSAVSDALTKYSTGMYHPNDRGAAAYGTAIADALRPDVKAKSDANTRLLPPVDVRIASVVPNGDITLRWHDVSNTETRYEVQAVPQLSGLLPAANPIRVIGANKQQFVHLQTSKAKWQYRVRACNATACSAFSAPIIGINYVPATPVGLTATTRTTPFTEIGQMRVLDLSWNNEADGAGVIEHVFHIHQTNPAGPTTDVRVAGPVDRTSIILSAVTPNGNVTTFPKAVYDVSVASCSRAGCSSFGPKVSVDAR